MPTRDPHYQRQSNWSDAQSIYQQALLARLVESFGSASAAGGDYIGAASSNGARIASSGAVIAGGVPLVGAFLPILFEGAGALSQHKFEKKIAAIAQTFPLSGADLHQALGYMSIVVTNTIDPALLPSSPEEIGKRAKKDVAALIKSIVSGKPLIAGSDPINPAYDSDNDHDSDNTNHDDEEQYRGFDKPDWVSQENHNATLDTIEQSAAAICALHEKETSKQKGSDKGKSKASPEASIQPEAKVKKHPKKDANTHSSQILARRASGEGHSR